MRLFSRNKDEAREIQPVIVEQPIIEVGELEQMIYSVYQEKLELENQLASAKRRIAELEETQTKLRAAETFSRQSESERKKADFEIEAMKKSQEKLNAKYQRAKAHNATLEVRIEELTAANQGRMDAYRRDLIAEIKQCANEQTGGWSKAKVLAFLDGCLRAPEEPMPESFEER